MSDISYLNSVYVYIVKLDGESKYKQKKYFCGPLRQIVCLANRNNEVNEPF